MAKPTPAVVETQEEIERAVTIVPLEIQEDFQTLSGHVARWGARLAAATDEVRRADHDLKINVKRAELALETGEAQLQRDHRAAPPPTMKVTEAALEALVSTDPEYLRLRNQLIEVQADCGEALIDAQKKRDEISFVMEALDAKKDMLVSLGAHMRAEMEGGISIRERR